MIAAIPRSFASALSSSSSARRAARPRASANIAPNPIAAIPKMMIKAIGITP
jgi:hypothetical protein